MLYVVDTTFYDKLNSIYLEYVINTLLLVQLFRYNILPKRYRYNDDSYEKETVFGIHNELFKKDPYYDERGFKSNTNVKFNYIKQHCLDNITGPFFVQEISIYRAVREFNKY